MRFPEDVDRSAKHNPVQQCAPIPNEHWDAPPSEQRAGKPAPEREEIGRMLTLVMWLKRDNPNQGCNGCRDSAQNCECVAFRDQDEPSA